jgi:hypothetical protein
VLLFGISTTALPSWVSRTRWNNLKNGLAVRRYGRSKRIDELISSIVREGHLSTAGWSSSFLLSVLISAIHKLAGRLPHLKRTGDGAAGDLTIVRPAAAAPPRRPEQVEQVGRHRAAEPRARARGGSEYGELRTMSVLENLPSLIDRPRRSRRAVATTPTRRSRHHHRRSRRPPEQFK